MDPWNTHADFLIAHSRLLLESFRHWTGRDLLANLLPTPDPDDPQALAHALWNAPFVVVSGGPEADQLLNYGNATALGLWEMDWNRFVGTPSRMTAEPMHRDERARFLKTVRKNGFIDNYSGIRISSTGKRFLIEKALVWNLVDPTGTYRGQAATFASWFPL